MLPVSLSVCCARRPDRSPRRRGFGDPRGGRSGDMRDGEMLEMYNFLGAPGDLSPVETDEFAMYRFTGGRIAELWGTADNARLRL